MHSFLPEFASIANEWLKGAANHEPRVQGRHRHHSFDAEPYSEPFEDAAAAYANGDYATALQLFRPLADQGMARAPTILGVMYATGQGVSKSDTEAMRWYRLAADQGNAGAQR
jgi:TPR repeat protein